MWNFIKKWRSNILHDKRTVRHKLKIEVIHIPWICPTGGWQSVGCVRKSMGYDGNSSMNAYFLGPCWSSRNVIDSSRTWALPRTFGSQITIIDQKRIHWFVFFDLFYFILVIGLGPKYSSIEPKTLSHKVKHSHNHFVPAWNGVIHMSVPAQY